MNISTNEDLAKLCEEAAFHLSSLDYVGYRQEQQIRNWRARAAAFRAMEPCKLVPLKADVNMTIAGVTGSGFGVAGMFRDMVAAAPEVKLP